MVALFSQCWLNLYISDGTVKQYNDEHTIIFLTRPIMEITITWNFEPPIIVVKFHLEYWTLEDIGPFIYIYVNIMCDR